MLLVSYIGFKYIYIYIMITLLGDCDALCIKPHRFIVIVMVYRNIIVFISTKDLNGCVFFVWDLKLFEIYYICVTISLL